MGISKWINTLEGDNEVIPRVGWKETKYIKAVLDT